MLLRHVAPARCDKFHFLNRRNSKQILSLGQKSVTAICRKKSNLFGFVRPVAAAKLVISLGCPVVFTKQFVAATCTLQRFVFVPSSGRYLGLIF